MGRVDIPEPRGGSREVGPKCLAADGQPLPLLRLDLGNTLQ
jgi:hypothetical protein